MSIEFIDPKGNPVVIRRPELVVAIKGYTRTNQTTGEVVTHSVVMFENREVVFVAGEPRVVDAAFADHERQARINSEYCDQCPALVQASDELKQYEVVADFRTEHEKAILAND